MVHLMSSEAKILIIAEGVKTEEKFFNHLKNLYGINIKVFCYGTNIYDLYKRLKKYEFNANIIDVLKEMPDDPNKGNDRSILDQKYAYTYLFFDFDAHHDGHLYDTVYDTIMNNIVYLDEMTKHFTNETDPTIGKLYLNYPMMESYRDCNCFFDINFQNNYISIEDLKNYKSLASSKRLASIHISNYQLSDVNQLLKMNIYQLSKLFYNCWDKIEIKVFEKLSEQSGILGKEKELIIANSKVLTLNTSLFFIVDYYGNRDGFYDKLFI